MTEKTVNGQPISGASFGDLNAALATAKGATKAAIQAELDRRSQA